MKEVRPYMLQAIVTKWLPLTSRCQSRIRATAAAGSIIVPWEHGLNADANHAAAARKLAEKFGWEGEWRGGGLPDRSGFAFVQTAPGEAPFFVTTGQN